MKNRKALKYGLAMCLVFAITASAYAQRAVKIYKEPLTLPTYKVGEPDKNPIFYTDRAYQGAQGEVYPYPMQNELTDKKVDKEWEGLFLENEFVKICVLPEMGGKMWYAIDKTNGYDFIYYNKQVKPALIGMLGAWTSGGLEWNIPHHHRASTYMPVDYEMQENADGSKTIWVGEIERRHRMKWRVGYTLYPGKSYLKTTTKLYNRTPIEHSFLIFANTAVHANEDYQVIFPPSTQYGTSHSKTNFTKWPISDTEDGEETTDVSWWKNHPTPRSIFDFGSGRFVAGYDHENDSGTLIVGNPHIITGRKFFEWGPGPTGSMWDDILTDTSGPYLELMAGAYSDNQPDYSWINPGMVKTADIYFSPLRNIEGVKKANTDAALNLEVTEGKVKFGVNTTGVFENATIILSAEGKSIYEEKVSISPNAPFSSERDLSASVNRYDLNLSLFDSDSNKVIAYHPVKQKEQPVPEAVDPPKPPSEIKTVDQLYRKGLRLEQFYNPTLDPMAYYDEALKRDPNHSLVNTQMGIYYLKKGNYKKAESHLRAAVATVTQNYTAPKNAESLYYLGLTLLKQGKEQQAYDWFYKSTWDVAWHAPAYYLIATIDALNRDYEKAIENLEHSLATNTLNSNAQNLKAAILRKTGKTNKAQEIVQNVAENDPLNTWGANELYLLQNRSDSVLNRLDRQMQDDVESYLELAINYGNAGFYDEALGVLNRAADSKTEEINSYPMVYYYRGYYREQLGKDQEAKKDYQKANKMPSDYCFPYRFKSAEVLKSALEMVPQDPKAHYYLGNLYYDNIPEIAIEQWEKSIELDSSNAIAYRNLAFAYSHILNNNEKAITMMEKALALNSDDPRYYAELDQYFENSGVSPEKRLAKLKENHNIVKKDDTALAREIRLLIFYGKYSEAIDILKNHHFRKIEGVGNIHNQWVDAYILRGRKRIRNEQYKQAIADFKQALTYPKNLEVGGGNREGEVYYFMGNAYQAMGKTGESMKYFRMATKSDYGWNEMKYRQALAYQRIGQQEKATQIFSGLIDRGQGLLSGDNRTDFFEKFSGDENENARKANANYLIGLGQLGLGNGSEADENFEKVLKLNPAHLGAKVLL